MSTTYDYTTALAELREIESTIVNSVERMRNAKREANRGQTSLAGLPEASLALRDWIDNEAQQNPEDQAIQRLKEHKDKIVADFIDRKTTADEMILALDPFNP